MKFMPRSRATCTARMASLMSMLRNSAPREDAPKLSEVSSRPVFPSLRFCIIHPMWHGRLARDPIHGREAHATSIHPHAHRQQNIREPLLIGGLNCEHVIVGFDGFIEIPFLDGLELQANSRCRNHL